MQIIGLQLDIVWENRAANHAKVRALLNRAQPQTGALVVLPEMFASGFSMNVADIHDSDAGETQQFLARTAAEYKIFLLGGVVTKDSGGRGRNEAVIYAPDGTELARYCKLHPFSLGGENEHYAAGARLCSFSWAEFSVAPFICYDLRFPEIFRHAAARGANLITVSACWPARRIDHWVTLLKARAIENLAYVIGVNRCGRDPYFDYPGRSVIFDPHGQLLADAGNEEGWITADLALGTVQDWRAQFPALRDARQDYAELAAQ
jgi:omega-amidase